MNVERANTSKNRQKYDIQKSRTSLRTNIGYECHTLGYQDVTTCKTMSGTLELYCDYM